MLNAIHTASQMSTVYAQTPRKEGVGVSSLHSQTTQPIAVNRSVESANALNSQSARPISYSPNIRDDRSTQITKSDDEQQDIQSQRSEALQKAQQEQQVQQVIRQLKARDTEVRAHEMAHLAAAGQYARGMSFTYQTGPDGQQYAIGGEVGIDTSPVAGNPEATIEKARVVQRAALAPAEPSNQDRRVAQAASQMMAQARVELSQQQAMERLEEQEATNSEDDNDSRFRAGEESRMHSIEPNSQEQAENSIVSVDRQQFNLRLQLPPAQGLLA